MTVDETRLQAILGIGYATSIRAGGLSLREALRVTGYADHRTRFVATDLKPIIAAQPVLVEQWLSYSEDKRTTGGWYISRDGEIGRISQQAIRRKFSTIQDAVAEYVVLELDFWAHASEPF